MLASGSPRRRELLSAAGYRFQVAKPDVRERADRHLTPREVTIWNAVAKGLAIAHAHPHNVVLAADTLVAFDGQTIGKPVDFDDAIRTLRRLRGKAHHVYSSVFVAHLATGTLQLISEISEVRFKRLTDQQIRDYLRKIDPLDKAGAYAAQGSGAEIIERIHGSYSNVVGLPMEQTRAMLRWFGIRPDRTATPPSPPRRQAAPARAGNRGAKRGKGTRR